MEKFPGMTASAGTECVHCSRDKHTPKAYSSHNNMHPDPVPQELLVRHICSFLYPYQLIDCGQGLTQVEEMLISAVIPIMSVHRLPQGQYGHSGHVVNLPQDVVSFAQSLPRLPSDVIIVRKEGANQTHRAFRVR